MRAQLDLYVLQVEIARALIDKKTPFELIVMVAANQPGFEHIFRTSYWFYADVVTHP